MAPSIRLLQEISLYNIYYTYQINNISEIKTMSTKYIFTNV